MCSVAFRSTLTFFLPPQLSRSRSSRWLVFRKKYYHTVSRPPRAPSERAEEPSYIFLPHRRLFSSTFASGCAPGFLNGIEIFHTVSARGLARPPRIKSHHRLIRRERARREKEMENLAGEEIFETGAAEERQLELKVTKSEPCLPGWHPLDVS